MSSFNEAAVEQKFATLNDSTESIQTVSLWLAYHQKHYKTYIEVWRRLFQRAPPTQMLRLLYVANDLVQVNRKKHPHLLVEFGHVFSEALVLTAKAGDQKVRRSVRRLLDVWSDRQLYETQFLNDIRKLLDEIDSSVPSSVSATVPVSEPITAPPPPTVNSRASSALLPLASLSNSNDEFGSAETLHASLKRTEQDDSKLLEQVRALPDHIFSSNTLTRAQSNAQLEDELDILTSAAVLVAKAEGRLTAQTEDRQAFIDVLTLILQRQQALLSRGIAALDECRHKSGIINDLRKQIKNKMDLLTAQSIFDTRPPPMLSTADIFGAQQSDQYPKHTYPSEHKMRQDQRYTPY